MGFLGEGGQGLVQRAWITVGDLKVDAAVKTVIDPTRQRALLALQHEAGMLFDLDHPNVLGLIGLCIDPGIALRVSVFVGW